MWCGVRAVGIRKQPASYFKGEDNDVHISNNVLRLFHRFFPGMFTGKAALANVEDWEFYKP